MNEHRNEARTSGAVSCLITSTKIVDVHEGRTELTIQNDDAANPVYLTLRTSPGTAPTAVASQGIKLAAGASWTTRTYRGDVYGIAVGGTVTVLVTDI